MKELSNSKFRHTLLVLVYVVRGLRCPAMSVTLQDNYCGTDISGQLLWYWHFRTPAVVLTFQDLLCQSVPQQLFCNFSSSCPAILIFSITAAVRARRSVAVTSSAVVVWGCWVVACGAPSCAYTGVALGSSKFFPQNDCVTLFIFIHVNWQHLMCIMTWKACAFLVKIPMEMCEFSMVALPPIPWTSRYEF